ncbi:hypothetical protein [Ileibacterium valens]|uniref:Uncharacterized protein n=1 Tax=Ileibacterium valens TaxID=1862668 RepID=A0A1U7NGB7_9FIRM|nr:hypothetical protein [Ileibacterium valens]OLU39942.1 hypothetical protein BO222_05845 [Ileibacterium valens]OLU41745.1 hypothetical protein BO224_03015 [Erysipelotrichaceae bacterium NYU-BL-E8]OLU43197.1 hypothetical protein BM735_00790 [Erysipelotrichaceae bacterium NYU-BL-F16]
MNDRIKGALLFLLTLFTIVVIVESVHGEFSSALIICLFGGILAMIARILIVQRLKSKNQKTDQSSNTSDT